MFIALLDGDVQQEMGLKYLAYKPGSELNIYW
jgi:predicted transport protein